MGRSRGRRGGRTHSPVTSDWMDTPHVHDAPTFSSGLNEADWEWPCFVRFKQRGEWVTERAKPVTIELGNDDAAKSPFAVIKVEDKEHAVVILHSASLIRVLKGCAPHIGLTDLHEGGEVNSKEIFLRRQGLQAYFLELPIADDSDADAALVWHAVKHLLRFIEVEFATALVQYERMTREGCVSYNMLWAFLPPGEEVCRRCLISDQECFATVKYQPGYSSSFFEKCYNIELSVMDFDGETYYKSSMQYSLRSFDGEKPFTSLRVCPLRFFTNRKEIETRFVSRGNKFYKVAMERPPQYMQFKGSLTMYSDNREAHIKKNADGRAIIDLLSFARMNPDYPMHNADRVWRTQSSLPPDQQGVKEKPSDEQLKSAPAIVYGFSFRLKKWGCFDLDGLQDIRFNEAAFDSLRMKDESQKEILWSLVQHYATRPLSSPSFDDASDLHKVTTCINVDPIANKGTGCIVLCHGPPGTGKTLTAEALTESMKCPLWSISAFELGAEPHVVEERLGQIMDIAHAWKAVLLLDEADTYLERRDSGVDVKRNMLMGVFLRVLEYYQGIMFLTTNRVMAFDDAILSRTTLVICYPALDDTQRVEIWKKLLSRAGMENVILDSDASLLKHPLNGRQIRSIVNLAWLLAQGRKQNFGMHHVLEAMEVFNAGHRALAVAD